MCSHFVSFHVEQKYFTCFTISNGAENKKLQMILHCTGLIQADYDTSRLHQKLQFALN